MQYGMTIDLKKCMGCHACATSCKLSNNLPVGNWWNRVMTIGGEVIDTAEGTYPNNTLQHMPLACQHCENPACTRVCPVGATYKREEDGIVYQDQDKCIGCRMCVAACPYTGVRNFNWEEPKYNFDFAVGDEDAAPHQKHTVEKCTLCANLIAKGELPKCVEACVGRARKFGDFDDPKSEVSRLISQRKFTKLLPEMGTNPSVYYLV